MDGIPNTKGNRSLIVSSRISWFFAAVAQLGEEQMEKYLPFAKKNFEALINDFSDEKHGGLFWQVDSNGEPVLTEKKVYGQGFALYAVAELFLATSDYQYIEFAKELHQLIQDKCHDHQERGYFENFTRTWEPISTTSINVGEMLEAERGAEKTMNAHIHLLEAYSRLKVALDRIEGYDRLKESVNQSLNELILITLDHIVDQQRHHLNLFMTRDFKPTKNGYGVISPGHDIELSWLLVEAAEAYGDGDLISRARKTAIGIASETLKFQDRDGSLRYEFKNSPNNCTASHKEWWVQYEAVVGFLNAYQLIRDSRFMKATCAAWDYTETKLVTPMGVAFAADLPEYTPSREWRGPYYNGKPVTNVLRSMWKGPYHDGRAALQIMQRVQCMEDKGFI
jgi:mannobiose 2-epimerase